MFITVAGDQQSAKTSGLRNRVSRARMPSHYGVSFCFAGGRTIEREALTIACDYYEAAVDYVSKGTLNLLCRVDESGRTESRALNEHGAVDRRSLRPFACHHECGKGAISWRLNPADGDNRLVVSHEIRWANTVEDICQQSRISPARWLGGAIDMT